MLTNRLELLSSRRNGGYGDALPLSYVSIIQKCLHPLIVFEFCYSLHLCITSRLGQKSTMQLRKRSFHLLSIVKFCRDKAERWIQTTLLPHKADRVPILDLSKQCDSLALQLRILGTAPTSIGPLQDTWHLICIFA